MSQIITYWLCPAEPARSHLSKIIKDLAARFDAPVFEPHVTLYVTEAVNEQPAAVLDERRDTGPFHLSVSGLNYSDEFTKTLFIQLEPDPRVARLGEDLRRASAAKSDYQLNPHLSLIYKKMSADAKRELARELQLPFREIPFDSIKAVLSPAEINSRADVEAWRTVAQRRLGG